MNRIELRGVIVPSSYDGEWANDYIERGLMMPESRFRKLLSSSDKKSPLELYINSPGGSVFSGNEMINAVNAWTKETGQPVEITVGAMAASMAAAMTVNVNAAKVRVHKNSKLMFHGAWTVTEGGSEAHKDEAGLLDKINTDIKTTLVSRFKLAPEKVDEWFAEGRAGWLSAQEAKDAGIAAEIIDSDDKAQKLNKTVSAMLSERGMRIAAILESEVIEEEKVENAEGKKQEDGQTPVPAVADAGGIEGGTQADAAVKADDGAEPEKPANYVAGLTDKINEQTEKIKEFSAMVTDLTIKNAELDKAKKSWQAKHDKTVAEHDKKIKDLEMERANERALFSEQKGKVEAEKKELEERLSKLTLGATSLDPDSAVISWQGAMDACNGDYVRARNQYPELFAAYLKNKQKNRKVK